MVKENYFLVLTDFPQMQKMSSESKFELWHVLPRSGSNVAMLTYWLLSGPYWLLSFLDLSALHEIGGRVV